MIADAPWIEAGGSVAAAVVLLAVLGYTVLVEPRLGVRFFEGFRHASDTTPERRERWYAALAGMQAASLIVVLAIVVALTPISAESVGLTLPAGVDGFAGGLVGGALAGIVIAVVATAFASYRGEPMPVVGDGAVLLPRTPRERGWVAAISVGAGTSEEVLYRGLLPALAVGAVAPVVVALVGQAFIFGLAHHYQGWSGVGITAVLGGVFGLMVVATGSLLIPVLLHVLIDARLALAPARPRPDPA